MMIFFHSCAVRFDLSILLILQLQLTIKFPTVYVVRSAESYSGSAECKARITTRINTLLALFIKILIYWDTALCRWMSSFRHLEYSNSLHLHLLGLLDCVKFRSENLSRSQKLSQLTNINRRI
jgi:hypothetical protein